MSTLNKGPISRYHNIKFLCLIILPRGIFPVANSTQDNLEIHILQKVILLRDKLILGILPTETLPWISSL